MGSPLNYCVFSVVPNHSKRKLPRFRSPSTQRRSSWKSRRAVLRIGVHGQLLFSKVCVFLGLSSSSCFFLELLLSTPLSPVNPPLPSGRCGSATKNAAHQHRRKNVSLPLDAKTDGHASSSQKHMQPWPFWFKHLFFWLSCVTMVLRCSHGTEAPSQEDLPPMKLGNAQTNAGGGER